MARRTEDFSGVQSVAAITAYVMNVEATSSSTSSHLVFPPSHLRIREADRSITQLASLTSLGALLNRAHPCQSRALPPRSRLPHPRREVLHRVHGRGGQRGERHAAVPRPRRSVEASSDRGYPSILYFFPNPAPGAARHAHFTSQSVRRRRAALGVNPGGTTQQAARP